MQDSSLSGDMEMKMVCDEPLTLLEEFLVHCKTSKRSPEVMDPGIVTIVSKLLTYLSTHLILMSTSPIENFRAEVFNKVAGVLDKHTKIPPDNEDGGLDKATYKDATRVTREVLLRIQSRIASGTLYLTQTLSDDAMQSVISHLFRLFEDKSSSEPERRTGKKMKPVKGRGDQALPTVPHPSANNRENQPIYPIIINASTIENFRVEVFNKVVSALETHGVCPSADESLDETTMEARLKEANEITRDVLLKFQCSIANGTLILTADTEDLTDDAVQAVISDALRVLEENLISSEPHDGPECVFQRRTWQRIKNTFTSCLCIRAEDN